MERLDSKNNTENSKLKNQKTVIKAGRDFNEAFLLLYKKYVKSGYFFEFLILILEFLGL